MDDLKINLKVYLKLYEHHIYNVLNYQQRAEIWLYSSKKYNKSEWKLEFLGYGPNLSPYIAFPKLPDKNSIRDISLNQVTNCLTLKSPYVYVDEYPGGWSKKSESRIIKLTIINLLR